MRVRTAGIGQGPSGPRCRVRNPGSTRILENSRQADSGHLELCVPLTLLGARVPAEPNSVPTCPQARTHAHTHTHAHSTRPILHIPATWPYRALALPAFLSRDSQDVVRQGTGGSPVDSLPGRGTGQPRQCAPGGFKSLGLRVAQAPGSAWSRSLLGQSGGLTRSSSPPPSRAIHTRTPQTPPQGAEALRSSLDPRSHNYGGRDPISQACRGERAGTSAGRQIPYCQERRRGKKKGRGRKTGNSQESTGAGL